MEFFTCVLLISHLLLVDANLAVNRDTLVAEAIQDALLTNLNALAVNKNPKTSAELLNAFKRASMESIQQGNARILFEDMVKKAERKVLESERKAAKEMASVESAEVQAENLAKELFHKVGSVLNKDEIARIHQESGCAQAALQVPDCSASNIQQFRTITGVCNNLRNPLSGAARTPFSRLLPAQYEDGLSQLRGTMQSRENTLLSEGPFSPPNPSPRLVSLTVVRDRPNIDDRYSHLMMQWGQFLDHDLGLAPAFRVVCTGCSTDDERCAPFRIPVDDPLFGSSNSSQLCHPFARSLPVCDQSSVADVNPRQQLNELTSFIDGSQIYGSSDEVLNAVRETVSGRLRTGQNIPGNDKSVCVCVCLCVCE